MKKEDLTGMIVYIFMLAIALMFGFTILKEYAGTSGLGNYFILFILGAILAGSILSCALVELGHVVGAKVGRYEVLSVNIMGFMLYKRDDKFKFKFGRFDGLGGETKIAPKEGKKPSNPTPYLLFPSFFLIIIMVVFVILFITLNNMSLSDKTSALTRSGYFLLTMAVIASMLFIYTIFPAQLDTMNDGYRLKLISNPKNKEAFNELLRVEKAIANGESDVEVKTFEQITNFTADLNLNKVYALLDNEKFEDAIPYIQAILNSKENISSKTFIRTRALYIYIMINIKPLEEALEYYNNEVPLEERKLIAADISMPSVRAYLLMSGLLDKSESETFLALNHVTKAYKRTPKNRQPIELRLYNKALQKVIDAHPKWELESFALVEK